MTPIIRTATTSDEAAAAAVLVLAFSTDPAARWAWPDPHQYLSHFPGFVKVFGGNAFVHDTLMMPDAGTSRADFPGGDAHALYRSIGDILALPDDTGVFVGHDYGPDGRDPACFSTVAEQKADNIHVGGKRSEADFVALRERRDATLPLPNLMLYALQVNIRGGRLPDPEANGRVYFRIPANRFEPTDGGS